MSEPYRLTPAQKRDIRRQVRELMHWARIFGIPKEEWPDKIAAKARSGIEFGPNVSYAQINAVNAAFAAEVRQILSEEVGSN